ncbi:MAG: T9SS type A sorting domain-containing protein [Chitinophagales bacterium]
MTDKYLNYCLVLLLIILGSGNSGGTCSAQSIPYAGPLTTDWLPCPFDTSSHYYSVSAWTAFHTLDNSVDGIADSAFCISLKADTSYSGISLAKQDIDTNRALFIRADLHPDNAILLEPDFPYNVFPMALIYIDPLNYVAEDSCSNGFCTGMIMERQVSGDGWGPVTIRNTYDAATFAQPGQDGAVCFASTHHTDQYLTSFTYKIQPRDWPDTLYIETAYDMAWMERDYYFYEPFFSLENMPGFYDHGEFVIEPYDVWSNSIMLANDKEGALTPDNQDTILVSPLVNPDTAVNILFLVNNYMTLIMQPNISILGALAAVEPVRHSVEIVNNGGTFCVGAIELLIGSGNRLSYRSGDLEMESPVSCIMFGGGGVLHVEKNAICTIGNNGTGILGFRPGGTVQLDEQAELLIEGNVRLFGEKDDRQSIYIDLPDNTAFRFGEYSHLLRGNSHAENMMLCFFMNGGTLDDSALSPEERRIIRRIYPSASNELGGNLQIVPNPARQYATIEFDAETDGTLYWQVMNTNGQLIQQHQTSVHIGYQAIDLPVAELNPGIYLIRFRFGNRSYSAKLVRE